MCSWISEVRVGNSQVGEEHQTHVARKSLLGAWGRVGHGSLAARRLPEPT